MSGGTGGLADRLPEPEAGTRAWGDPFIPSGGLRVVASSPLPPPAVGSACIFEGSIPEPIGKDPNLASISFLLQGSPTVEWITDQGSIRRQVRAGSFGIAPMGQSCAYRTEGTHVSLNLAMEDQTIQSFARSELNVSEPRVELVGCLEGTEPVELVQLGFSFARLIRSQRQGAALYAETLWTQILLQLLWHHSSLVCQQDREAVVSLASSRIHGVIDFMMASLADDISLSDLAREAGLSAGYFLRSFKQATGKTPIQFRHDLRISRACELLRGSTLEVSEIAARLGFSSHSHFSNAFRRVKGVSPTAYRRHQA